MKKKTIIILAAGLAALILAAAAGLPLFSRLYYGRSQAATMFAWQFHKDKYTTQERFDAYLRDKSAENSQLYSPPPPREFTVPMKGAYYGDMTWYTLGKPSSATLVVYFPGGSYIDQPRPIHWQFLNGLAADTGAAVVVPIYPKLPANDAAAAYALMNGFCKDVLAELRYDRLIFMGDSAGGGMAISLAMQQSAAGGLMPDAIVALSPWVDVTMDDPDIPAYERKDPALDSGMLRHLGALWAGDLSVTDPVVSPLYGDMTTLLGCDVTLIVGTGELLYPDVALFDEALAAAGVSHRMLVASGMFHVWPLYKDYGIPEARESYGEILDILK